MEACVTQGPIALIHGNPSYRFQNRKRYGGMRDTTEQSSVSVLISQPAFQNRKRY